MLKYLSIALVLMSCNISAKDITVTEQLDVYCGKPSNRHTDMCVEHRRFQSARTMTATKECNNVDPNTLKYLHQLELENLRLRNELQELRLGITKNN
jgi:hypothetical protein